MAGTSQPADAAHLAAPVEARPPAQEAKRDLTSWWKQFKKNSRKEEEKPAPASSVPEIFGTPLADSIKFANVAISLSDENGQSFTYGYVPIVVAKCGVFLKDKATEIEGIFRLAGAERRIKELQSIFNSPPRYGKGLNWDGYTVHDAANVLRRYFNTLPEPIIPLRFYQRFREPLRHHQGKATREGNDGGLLPHDFDAEKAIKTYQTLITELPALNRQLLLYVLDLMAVFASKSDINRMTASNLALIFQPGLISHPSHQMAPEEYGLSQNVLTFLIENQDNFLFGMQGTAVDSETIQKMQEAAQTPPKPASPNTPAAKAVSIGRSASTASAGAESVRRYGGVRRNVSTSSRRSRQSQGSPSPVTPTIPPESPQVSGGGIQRSNTVPSRKSASPAINQSRFAKPEQTPSPSQPSSLNPSGEETPKGTPAAAPPAPSAEEQRKVSTVSAASEVSTGSQRMSPHLRPVPDRRNMSIGQEPTKLELQHRSSQASGSGTPSKERTFSSIFRSSPGSDAEKSQQRQPNRLKKKRPENNAALSAHSSNHSLGHISPALGPSLPEQDFPGPLDGGQFRSVGRSNEQVNTSSAGKFTEEQTPIQPTAEGTAAMLRDSPQRDSSVTLKPGQDHLTSESTGLRPTGNEPAASEVEKQSRWQRLSGSHARNGSQATATQDQVGHQNLAASSTLIGSASGAERSTSTIGSTGMAPGPRKSFTSDSHQSQASGDIDQVIAGSATGGSEQHQERERRGLRGWIRGKLDERKERDAEKDRNKSPPPPRMSSASPGSSGKGEEVAVDPSQRRSQGFSSNHPALNPFSQSPGPETEAIPAQYQNFGGRVLTPPGTTTGAAEIEPANPPAAASTEETPRPFATIATATEPTNTDTVPTPTQATVAAAAESSAAELKEPEPTAAEPRVQPEQTIRAVAPEPATADEPTPSAAAAAASAVAQVDVAQRPSQDGPNIPGAFQ